MKRTDERATVNHEQATDVLMSVRNDLVDIARMFSKRGKSQQPAHEIAARVRHARIKLDDLLGLRPRL